MITGEDIKRLMEDNYQDHLEKQAHSLAFDMYPKDLNGNYDQREDFPEYVRMAYIAINKLQKPFN